MPQKQPKRGRLWLTDGSCIRRRPEDGHHVWAYDFVAERTHDGRPLKILSVVDEYSRECLAGVRGRSLKTTNCLESITALVEERCAKVDHGQNSSQRHRWLATALLDIEPRLRTVRGYRHLPTLRIALKRDLKINTTTSKRKAA